ncbi:hypothetical protein ABZ341_18195 [Streptomyces sp. NPDC006173]|uniref:hypothetical protein n=1 Tax=Streptomyces sp. NPDC006173 TaxID=3155349 RepID=UPI0033C24F36
MTTTALAATQANVTVATIRAWCRHGVIAAVKTAGRWVIDTASLAHRITVGTWRNRVTAPTPGTMADRGQDYVAAWPANIAAKSRLSPEHVAEALTRAGLAEREDQMDLRMKFLHGEPVAQIAALTPDSARLVIAELRSISDEINTATKTHCHYCSLKLRADGECPSCGTGA